MTDKRNAEKSHRARALAMITEKALDAQITEDAAEDNELAYIIVRHGGPDADGYAPHDAYEHCERCCWFVGCRGDTND